MSPLAAVYIKSFRFIDDNTFELVFNDATVMDIDGIEAIHKYISQFTEGKRVKRLVISGRGAEIKARARQLGEKLSEDARDYIIAEAVVVHSLTQKMVANFYFKYLKDLYPTKFFTDETKAREWLAAQH